MNITRTISEDVATKMVAPIAEKIKNLKEERKNIIDKVVSNAIPQDLKDCYQKYSSYFRESTDVCLCAGTHEIRVNRISPFPSPSTWYPRVETDNSVIEQVDKLQLRIKKADEEKDKMYSSIVSTLLSLRTFKRVKEQFPDAYDYLISYEKKVNNAISLPIDNILSTIQKYK